MWQKAEAGAVTLPYMDDDLHGVTTGTYIVVVEGAELIVAWRQYDLHEDQRPGAYMLKPRVSTALRVGDIRVQFESQFHFHVSDRIALRYVSTDNSSHSSVRPEC